ncbi:MAG: DUF1553 domain-containing protein [Planctomycetes bacterium]|nr:DUF1553 domain-containing protein [Planctomycetota bacterium]
MAVLFGMATSALIAAEPERVQFNRDIRSILSDKCFACHGPDSAARKADLRLDQREAALADRDGDRPIVPGQKAASEVFRRLTATDDDERMPPAKSGLRLTPREIELLGRWIDEGAEYQAHWSFIAPKRPSVPAPKQAEGLVNPIDAFIRERLAAEKLAPAPEADRTTLIRRVTFDLTGLPPTPAEVDNFLADAESGAYERLVDRLLASPHYGERMATQWLDAARFADTNGYQSDEQRFMWRWRDWVIDAFNRNQPFDQFTIEQLAGDLLPKATLEQQIATGFNRNHRANSEGGIIPEEFLVEYAVDRLDTTATVWLGLTVGCARCHDHKYDPVTQKEFYRLMAFFNNVPEEGKVSRTGNAVPMIKAPTPELSAEATKLDAAVAEAQTTWNKLAPELAKAQAAWEQSDAADGDADSIDGLAGHYELDGSIVDATDGKLVGKAIGGEPNYSKGQFGQALQLKGDRYVEVPGIHWFTTEKFSYGAWVYAESNDPMGVMAVMNEDESYRGYDLYLDGGKVQADMCSRLLDDSIRVETIQPITLKAWHHLLVTYDGSRQAKGVKIYVDGVLQPLKVLSNTLSNVIKLEDEPLTIGARGTGSKFRGLIDDVRYFDHELTTDEIATLSSAEPIGQLVEIAPDKRTAPQAQKIQTYFVKHDAPAPLRAAHARLLKAQADRTALEQRIPTTMVMQEKPMRDDTFVLIRGEYDKPGEKVAPGGPASLPPIVGQPLDRLALARWLVDRQNPLTARVTVNRFWQLYFGNGLVKTTEDFGSQGELPKHPELLDWLAVEFIDTGWDVKRLQKLIVTSATYRQSSRVTPALVARDPENRLLARGPRYRLSAEMIRDAALFNAGLLVDRVGGPSVKPYQPPGLWEELGATAGKYPQDHGEALYRRSMYTFWKRTIPPPNMMIFDAPGREMCSVRPVRTNTPLQALALLNETAFVEAAGALAERAIKSAGSDPNERIALMFHLCTARAPRPRELEILRAGYERHLADYRARAGEAEKLLGVGESKRDPKLDRPELAATTVIASLILNLDETITKE